MKRLFTLLTLVSLVTACTPSDSSEQNNSNLPKTRLVKEISLDWTNDGKGDLTWNFTYNALGEATTITEKWDLEYLQMNCSWEIEYLADNKMYITEKVDTPEDVSGCHTYPFIIELNDNKTIDSFTWTFCDKVELEYTYNTNGYLTDVHMIESNSSHYYTSNIWEDGNLKKAANTNGEFEYTQQFTYNNISATKINLDLYPFLSYPSELCPWYNLPLQSTGTRNSFYLLAAGYIGKTNANYLTEISEVLGENNKTVAKFQWVYDENGCPVKCINSNEWHRMYTNGTRDEYGTCVATISYVE